MHSAPPNAVGSSISTQAINISLLLSEEFNSPTRGATDLIGPRASFDSTLDLPDYPEVVN
jgi:hypothetical protein